MVKRKLIFTGILSILSLFVVSAQDSRIKLRHMEGFKAVSIGYSFMKSEKNQTQTFILGYTHYLSEKIFWDVSINYESGEIHDSEISNPFIRINANYTLVSVGNNIYINASGGIFGGLEIAKSKVLDEKNNTFAGGINIGPSIEFYLSNMICLEPFFSQYIQFGSDMGSAYYQSGINLKINF